MTGDEARALRRGDPVVVKYMALSEVWTPGVVITPSVVTYLDDHYVRVLPAGDVWSSFPIEFVRHPTPEELLTLEWPAL